MAINPSTPQFKPGTYGYDTSGKPKPIFTPGLSFDKNTPLGFNLGVYNSKATKKAKAAYAKKVAQAKVYSKQAYQYQKSEQALRQGMAGVDKAYEAAKLQASRGAEQARQTVRQEGQAAGAAATQSMMNRGLYGTTVQDQAQRAVTSDMARNLGMIDASLAAEQGELGVSQAMAKSAGLGGIASLYPALAGMQTDTMFKFYQAFKPPPPKPKTNIFGKILGGVLGAFGGGLGQAAGAAAGSSMFGGGGGGAVDGP